MSVRAEEPAAGYTPVYHSLMEALVAAPLRGSQLRLLLHLLRQSLGYQRKTATLSHDDFSQATGIHPKAVARELRDLEARHIVVVFRAPGKRSSLAVEQDTARWATGSNPAPPDREQSCSPPGAKLLPVREQSCSPPSLYVKENLKERATVSHETGPPAAPARSGTTRERFAQDYREATNKVAVCATYLGDALGVEPDYARAGQLLKAAGSGGAFIAAVLKAAGETISDDPYAYVAVVIKREKDRQHGRDDAPIRGSQGRAGRDAWQARRLVEGRDRSIKGGYDSFRDGAFPTG